MASCWLLWILFFILFSEIFNSITMKKGEESYPNNSRKETKIFYIQNCSWNQKNYSLSLEEKFYFDCLSKTHKEELSISIWLRCSPRMEQLLETLCYVYHVSLHRRSYNICPHQDSSIWEVLLQTHRFQAIKGFID